MPRLLVEKGLEKGKTVALMGKQILTVGREPTVGLILADPLASRHHCRIEARGTEFAVIDLNSRNGTFVNGKSVREEKLQTGDVIRIGETMISFLADEPDGKKDRLVGQSIKGYRIIERVGRGGMGTVYKAEQLSLRRTVALKILSPELVKDKSFIHLFIQEARAAAQLNHTNIVQVYDIDREGDVFYFSMEFVPNGSVQDLLAREKYLSPKAAVPILIHAARGLEYAERKQIIHRDIKPDNLFIGEDGVVKIGDLGLARSLADQPAEGSEGTVFGTPHYIAPEQALGKQIDHRADIYALGASAYRMLAGTTPYTGASIREIILKKLKEPAPPLKSIVPTTPDSLAALVERMMNKNVEDRPQSATTLIDELAKIKAEVEGSGTSKYAAPIGVDSEALPPRSRAAWIGTVVAAFLVLCVGGFFLVRELLKEKPIKVINDKPPIVKTPVKPDPQPGDSKYLERLAEKNWESAENAERNLRADDMRGYDTVIELYRKVIAESPGTALTLQVEEKIAALERERRETSARVAFKEAGAKMESFIAKFSKSLDMSGLEDIRQELETVARLYADTEAAAQLSGPQLDRLNKWKEAVDKVRPKFETMRQEVSLAVEEKRFSDALAMLFTFSVENRENPYTPAVRDVAEKVGRETVGHIVGLLEEARNLRNRRQYEEALAVLQGLVDKFSVEITPGKPNPAIILEPLGVPVLIGRARKEMGEIRAQVESERTIAERQKRDTEKRMLEKANTDTASVLHEYGFDKALSILEETKAKLTIADYASEAAWKIELFSRAEAIRHALIERANKTGEDGLKNPFISLGSMGRCKVIGAVETERESVLKIEVPVAGGTSATMSWPWKVKELPPQEVYFHIRNAWNLTTEEMVNLAVLCRVMSAIDPGLEPKVEPLCKDAKKRAKAEKNTKLVEFIDRLLGK